MFQLDIDRAAPVIDSFCTVLRNNSKHLCPDWLFPQAFATSVNTDPCTVILGFCHTTTSGKRCSCPSRTNTSRRLRLGPSKNSAIISRPMRAPRRGGTAFPTCLIGWREVPENAHQSGNDCMRADSRGETSRGSYGCT